MSAPAHICGYFRSNEREKSRQRKKWILAQRRKGRSCQEIADDLGIGLDRVYKIQQQAGGTRYFQGAAFYEYLSPEVWAWMSKEKPADVSMEQFVASIVTDAYAEETDAGTR